jgi:spore coat polysaccharide biosynthesis protein SpsF
MAQPRRTTIAILQARLGSTRLPGKSIAPVLGRPMLAIILERLRCSRRVDRLVVATTSLREDDAIETLARSMDVACYRGSENDLLDRYYQAARQYPAEVIARLTADNPLVEGEFLDWVLEQFAQPQPVPDLLYTSSKSFPLGMSVEVFPFTVLEKLWHEDNSPESREHVMTRAYYHPESYRVHALSWPQDYSHMRWTVDEADDLRFVTTVFEALQKTVFPWREAATLVERHPEWLQINSAVVQKTV